MNALRQRSPTGAALSLAFALGLLSLLAPLLGCKRGSPVEEDERVTVQHVTRCAPQAPDAWSALERWIALDAKEQSLSEPARALRATWSELHVARAWRLAPERWAGLITGPPGLSEQALRVFIERVGDDQWRVSREPAQVVAATTLWPEL